MTTEKDEVKTYEIPEWNMQKLRDKIAKINKRGAKIKCAPLQLIVHEEKLVPDYSAVPELTEEEMAMGYKMPSADELPKIKVVVISIVGEPPKIAGWSFIGTLDHYSIPGKVIVNAVPGNTVPKHFHTSEPICDHCNKIRRRAETFVLRKDESGDLKQVGRQCVKDFIGHDPSRMASYLEAVWKLAQDLDEGEEYTRGAGGMRTAHQFQLEAVLHFSAAAIRTLGWVSRKQSMAMNDDGSLHGKEATASIVSALFSPNCSRKLREKVIVEDADKKEAELALTWLKDQKDFGDSNYFANLQTIVSTDHVPHTTLGYVVSLIPAYHRAMDRDRQRKAERRLNEWIGNPKDKVELTVKVMGTTILPGYMANSSVKMYRMMDNEGRSLVWFASGAWPMEEGNTYRVKGTIKKHGEYKDWKQTILTRVKVLEQIVVEEANG